MIIKMTVNDNDFTQNIEKFCNKLIPNLCYKTIPKNISSDYEKVLAFYKAQEKVQRLLVRSRLTDEDKKTIQYSVFECWWEYVDKQNWSAHTKKYLKEHFKCVVLSRFADRWENGEVVYYFTTNQKWITQ